MWQQAYCDRKASRDILDLFAVCLGLWCSARISLRTTIILFCSGDIHRIHSFNYQSLSQYDTDYPLPIPLSVWHQLHIVNPSLIMTLTTHYHTDYTLPIPLSVWHWRHVTNWFLSHYGTTYTLPITLSVWNQLSNIQLLVYFSYQFHTYLPNSLWRNYQNYLVLVCVPELIK